MDRRSGAIEMTQNAVVWGLAVVGLVCVAWVAASGIWFAWLLAREEWEYHRAQAARRRKDESCSGR
jgi:hypothetical protein